MPSPGNSGAAAAAPLLPLLWRSALLAASPPPALCHRPREPHLSFFLSFAVFLSSLCSPCAEGASLGVATSPQRRAEQSRAEDRRRRAQRNVTTAHNCVDISEHTRTHTAQQQPMAQRATRMRARTTAGARVTQQTARAGEEQREREGSNHNSPTSLLDACAQTSYRATTRAHPPIAPAATSPLPPCSPRAPTLSLPSPTSRSLNENKLTRKIEIG